MSALKELVRRFREAMGGPEARSQQAAPAFNWEPTAAPAPLEPVVPEQESPGQAAGPTPIKGWKRAPAEPSSVVGTGIPADVADFGPVYKGAGVTAPNHGYGVDRVGGMLNHKSLAGLDRTVKASAVLAALDAAGVAIADVIHDAVLRYKALIAFEAAKDLETSAIRPRNESRIEELKREIDSFRSKKNAEISELTREMSASMQALGRLRTRARAEQERYHRAVSLFVESLPARVIPIAPKPGEPAASGPEAGATAERAAPPAASPDLKLVTSTPQASAPSAAPPEPPPAAQAPPAAEPVKEAAASTPAAEVKDAGGPKPEEPGKPAEPPASEPK
jgi:hypothetical protein